MRVNFLRLLTFVLCSLCYSSTYAEDSQETKAATIGERSHIQYRKTHRIINGSAVHSDKWPSVVAILRKNPRQTICGGNLISRRWVLTAAHCFHTYQDGRLSRYSPNTLQLYVGSPDMDDGQGDFLSLGRIILHPGYNHQTAVHDIALVELPNPVNRRPMPLYFGEPRDGVYGHVAGWGTLTQQPELPASYPSRMHELQVPVVPRSLCNDSYAYNGKIQSSMFCAGYRQGGKDACSGDSGGPLMMVHNGTYHQAGIVSFGDGCAKPNKYGVYTLVSAYHDWIRTYVDSVYIGGKQSETVYAMNTYTDQDYKQSDANATLAAVNNAANDAVPSKVSYPGASGGSGAFGGLFFLPLGFFLFLRLAKSRKNKKNNNFFDHDELSGIPMLKGIRNRGG